MQDKEYQVSQEIHLALYLKHLSESTGSKAATEEAVRVAGLLPVPTGAGDSSGFEAVVGKAKKA